jgi:uncharacterized protein YndB with AHSA1/START domain
MTRDQQRAQTATITTPWGSRDTTTVVDQMDVRPGGTWRSVI